MKRTTVVVVVVHTPNSILKNDCTRTVIRTSKCTVPMIPNPKKILEFFLKFLGDKKTFEQYILSASAEKSPCVGVDNNHTKILSVVTA